MDGRKITTRVIRRDTKIIMNTIEMMCTANLIFSYSAEIKASFFVPFRFFFLLSTDHPRKWVLFGSIRILFQRILIGEHVIVEFILLVGLSSIYLIDLFQRRSFKSEFEV